jgi:aminoglycoside phosphotransferase (APT) family kinase protein
VEKTLRDKKNIAGIDDSVRQLVSGVKRTRVRSEMNARVLEAFIERQPGILGRVEVSNIATCKASGMSSATFFFTAEIDEGQGRHRRELVARLHPGAGVFHEYDFRAQFEIQRALRGAGLPVPTPLWLDAEGGFLGAPGFVMERVVGTAPDQAFFSKGLFLEASPNARKKMITDAILNLARVHSVNWRSLGLGFLAVRGKGRTPIQREIDWTWNELRIGKPEVMQQLDAARSWLLANEPALEASCLVHGDPNLANFLFRDDCVAAILDWELAYLGTPECDLAYMVWTNRLVSQGMAPLPGVPVEEEIKTIYEGAGSHKIREWEYYYTLQVFRSYVHHELAFRSLPPEFLQVHQPYLEFVRNSLLERIS